MGRVLFPDVIVSIPAILCVHLLAAATPGPDFAVVTHRSMAHGRRAGIAVAGGIATGMIAHVVFALLGLGALLHAMPALSRFVSLAGAGYLAWIAWCCLRPPRSVAPGAPADTPRHGDYLAGLLTNLLNPKVVLYFGGLFSQVDLSQWSVSRTATLGAGIIVVTFLWFLTVAVFFSTGRVLRFVERRRRLFDITLGMVLGVFAIMLAVRALRA